MVEAIENHRFDPLRDIEWRNNELDFRSVPALIASLNRPPPHAALQRVREQDDQLALQALSAQSDFLPRLHTLKRVKLLWEVCQVPDFRKTMTEEHTTLLGQLFAHLTQGGERLPEDWIESHIKRLEHYDGDIDTLMARIAHVRTWTYISHRPDWIQRAVHWQERARAIEDKLSDVLHQRLMQRFVDRRAALLVRRLHDEGEMTSSVAEAGEVSVEGEHLGRIEGFRFVPDTTEGHADQKAVLSAALRALRQDLPARLQAFAGSADGELVFDSQLRVCWGGGPVARLLPSGDILAPKVEVLSSDLLDGPAREEVRKRAAAWVETRIRLGLSELMDARATAELGRSRTRLRTVLRRIEGRQEWGVRVSVDEATARTRARERAQKASEGLAAGAGFLTRKRQEHKEVRDIVDLGRTAADEVFEAVARYSDETQRRPPVAAEPGLRLLLDAAFLVPAKRVAAFRESVRKQAERLAAHGYRVVLTGPWPPYNFVAGAR
jgi:hypothetical protein